MIGATDRGDAATLLRAAATEAASIGARHIERQIRDLARRHGIRLGGGNEGSGTRGPTALTAREQQVLRLVAEGRSNGEIGTELFISTNTASVHVSDILAKLGVSSRIEAAALPHRGRGEPAARSRPDR